VIWVGTGESNVRNSVSLEMVFTNRLTAVRNWQHMGLKDTETHLCYRHSSTKNPDIVYVGAVGHAFAPNEERGVFMTTDGGKTWTKDSLYRQGTRCF